MTASQTRPPRASETVDSRLEQLLRHAIAIGAVLLLLLPAARGHHAVIGWLPMWLLAMPLTAWWALHRFRLPMRQSDAVIAMPRHRRSGAQARRRPRPARRAVAVPRAA